MSNQKHLIVDPKSKHSNNSPPKSKSPIRDSNRNSPDKAKRTKKSDEKTIETTQKKVDFLEIKTSSKKNKEIELPSGALVGDEDDEGLVSSPSIDSHASPLNKEHKLHDAYGKDSSKHLYRNESSSLLFSESLYSDPLSDSDSEFLSSSQNAKHKKRSRGTPSGLMLFGGSVNSEVHISENDSPKYEYTSDISFNGIQVHNTIKPTTPKNPIKVRTVDGIQGLIEEFGADGPFEKGENPFKNKTSNSSSRNNDINDSTTSDVIIQPSQEKEKDVSKITIPIEFKDPVTGFILIYPTQTTYGPVYESDIITNWFNTSDVDPVTKALVTDKKLSPAEVLKARIDTFLEKNPSIIMNPSLFVIPKRMLDEVSELLSSPINEEVKQKLKKIIGSYMEAFLRPNQLTGQNLMHILAEQATFEVFEFVTREIIGSDIVYINKSRKSLNQEDFLKQTPLDIAFNSIDFRIFLYLLSFLRIRDLKQVVQKIVQKVGKKAMETYIENASEMQYQFLINDIVRLDTTERSKDKKKEYYNERTIRTQKENEIIEALEEVLNFIT